MVHLYGYPLFRINIVHTHRYRTLDRSLLVNIYQMRINMEIMRIFFFSIRNIRIQVIEIAVNCSVLHHFDPRSSAH